MRSWPWETPTASEVEAVCDQDITLVKSPRSFLIASISSAMMRLIAALEFKRGERTTAAGVEKNRFEHTCEHERHKHCYGGPNFLSWTDWAGRLLSSGAVD